MNAPSAVLLATGPTVVVPALDVQLPYGVPTEVPAETADYLLTFPGVELVQAAPVEIPSQPMAAPPAPSKSEED